MGSKLVFHGKKKERSLSKGPEMRSESTFSTGLSLPKVPHPSHHKTSKHSPSGSLGWLSGNPFHIPHPHFSPSQQKRKKLSQEHTSLESRVTHSQLQDNYYWAKSLGCFVQLGTFRAVCLCWQCGDWTPIGSEMVKWVRHQWGKWSQVSTVYPEQKSRTKTDVCFSLGTF